mmetsp:Transcript_363/g.906  ORF Transcript_363/g.906 Transcript_363/m.906 type:complete len:174 (+) Transcript_363:97-618(+)
MSGMTQGFVGLMVGSVLAGWLAGWLSTQRGFILGCKCIWRRRWSRHVLRFHGGGPGWVWHLVWAHAWFIRPSNASHLTDFWGWIKREPSIALHLLDAVIAVGIVLGLVQGEASCVFFKCLHRAHGGKPGSRALRSAQRTVQFPGKEGPHSQQLVDGRIHEQLERTCMLSNDML